MVHDLLLVVTVYVDTVVRHVAEVEPLMSFISTAQFSVASLRLTLRGGLRDDEATVAGQAAELVGTRRMKSRSVMPLSCSDGSWGLSRGRTPRRRTS